MRRGIFKAVFSVTGIILIAKLLGFFKQMTAASLFGATLKTDLITLSQGVLGDLQYVLTQILLTAFTAVYIRHMDEENGPGRYLTVDTMKAFSLIALGISSLVFLAAPLAAWILAPGYGAEEAAQLTVYIRIHIPLLPLFAFTAVFQSLLNSHRCFIPGEMVSVNQSLLFLLIVYLLSRPLGERSMIVAFFAYTVWNLFFLGALSRQYWGCRQGGNPFVSPLVKELLRMSAPLLLSYSMVFINQQVDKSLTSGLGNGAVTALGYGSTLSNLINTFIISFCSILFTYTASAISSGNHPSAAALAVQATGLLTMVFLPVSLLTVLCAQDIVTIAFGRGAFDAAAVDASAHALRGYGFIFIPMVLREVYTRFQYGYQDSRHPTIASATSIVCNIVLSILLSRRCGIFGIAFATSVSVLVCGILNLVYSRKLNHFLDITFMLRGLPWISLASVACLAVAVRVNGLLADATAYFRFPAAAFCALAIYFLLVSPALWKLLRKGTLR